jgi:hypothetical protein
VGRINIDIDQFHSHRRVGAGNAPNRTDGANRNVRTGGLDEVPDATNTWTHDVAM